MSRPQESGMGTRRRIPRVWLLAALIAVVAVVAGVVLLPPLLTPPSIRVGSLNVDAYSTGSPLVSASAFPIGLRPTNASGLLPALPVTIVARANLTVIWQLYCGGNTSFRCTVTSVAVNLPFRLSYSPVGSNFPWVWSGIRGGDDVLEQVYLLGPSSPGDYGLTLSLNVTDVLAAS